MLTKLLRLTLLASLVSLAACGGSAPKEGENECETNQDCGPDGFCADYEMPTVCR